MREEPGREVVAPRPFSLVCFRRDASDEENAALPERVNATGEALRSHTKLNARRVLRLAVGNAGTTGASVRLAWDVLRREAADSQAEVDNVRAGVEAGAVRMEAVSQGRAAT